MSRAKQAAKALREMNMQRRANLKLDEMFNSPQGGKKAIDKRLEGMPLQRRKSD